MEIALGSHGILDHSTCFVEAGGLPFQLSSPEKHLGLRVIREYCGGIWRSNDRAGGFGWVFDVNAVAKHALKPERHFRPATHDSVPAGPVVGGLSELAVIGVGNEFFNEFMGTNLRPFIEDFSSPICHIARRYPESASQVVDVVFISFSILEKTESLLEFRF